MVDPQKDKEAKQASERSLEKKEEPYAKDKVKSYTSEQVVNDTTTKHTASVRMKGDDYVQK